MRLRTVSVFVDNIIRSFVMTTLDGLKKSRTT
jgi:hypothetical protein